jgi:hypothetical protein
VTPAATAPATATAATAASTRLSRSRGIPGMYGFGFPPVRPRC